MLTLLVLLVVGFILYRIVAAIWRASNALTIASSWGIVLAGQAEKEQEVIEAIHGAVEDARIGPVWWRRHSDRFLGLFTGETHTYSAIGFGGVQALSGVHPVGTDLYVSWNLVARGRASTHPGEEFGLNATNHMRAFASATLGITQEAAMSFGFGDGSDELTASGLLGPIVPRRPHDAAPEDGDDG